MKKVAILTLLLFSAAILHGQRSIETRLCYSDSTSFSFSGEWQYLSTDIYLLNGNKFSKVINDLNTKPGGRRKKKSFAEEKLEYLYITAQLVNVKFFGDNNVIYPLYNFRINTDKNNKYETYVSDNIESIRIIDNLPLYSASDKIDAKIDVQAISYNDRDNILGVIGAQLRNLGNFSQPTSAVLSLIGEIGSFIESNTKKKEYKFSSTIRLFEQKNFDTRLHSLRVYALVSPNSPPVRIDTQNISKFVDTCTTSEVTRQQLEKLLSYKLYPLIVVANYKSLYRMQSISGDEINFASIDKRKLTIENNYRNKLISEETYRQERDFIDFLTVFANFKSKLELYTLNARMGNNDAAMTALGVTIQYYNSLQQEFSRIAFKYRDNKTFDTIFKSEYGSILDFASFYLEGDHNLRAAKQMVRCMRSLNDKGIPKRTQDIETALSQLWFISNMDNDFKRRAKEGRNIETLIKSAEDSLFTLSFRPDIERLANSAPTSDTITPLIVLRNRVTNTHCERCRKESLEAIKSYSLRLESALHASVVNYHDSLAAQVEIRLIDYAQKTDLAARNLGILYPDSTSMSYSLLYRKVRELNRDVENLQGFLTFDITDKPTELINSLNEKVQETDATIANHLNELKSHNPSLLEPSVIGPQPYYYQEAEPLAEEENTEEIQ